MDLDFSQFSANQIYDLMTQTVIPRPIAWALTNSGDDTAPSYNLAPFSYFAPVSSNPPLLMLSVGNKTEGVPKDTVLSVLKNPQMTIHIAHDSQFKEVTQTAASLEFGVSEIEHADLQLTEFEGFSLPRLKKCDIAFGCELYEVKEIGDAPQHLVFVEVKKLYISDRVSQLDDKGRINIDPQKVQPLARLGASLYAKQGEVFSQKRPD